MRRQIFLNIIFLVLISFSVSANEVEKYLQKQEKTVYFVTSYNDNNEWTRRVRAELASNLRKSGYLINMRNIYLDANSLMSKNARRKVVQSYLDGVNEIIDVFVATDFSATETMLSFSPEERAHIPLVFVSENGKDRIKDSLRLATGGIAEIGFDKTFEFGKRVLPKTNKVYVWADKTSLGRHYLKEAKQQLQKYEGELQIEYGVDAINSDQLLQKVTALPPNSFVIFCGWIEDDTHHYHNPEYLYSLLTKVSPVPVFSVVDNFVRNGFVGGYVVSPKKFGEVASKKVLSILNGNSVDNLPIEKIEPVEVFNQRTMNRWNIAGSNVPDKARLVNWETTLRQRYLNRVRTIKIFCLFLFLVISVMVFLYWQRQKRLKASLFRESLLHQTKEKLKFRSELLSNTISSLREGMITIGSDMRILECNDIFCNLVEMDRQDLIGQPFNSVCELADIDSLDGFFSEILEGAVNQKIIRPMFLISRGGVSRYVEGQALSLTGSTSETTGVILLLCDVLDELRQQKIRSISLNALNAYTWYCDLTTGELVFGEGLNQNCKDAGEINSVSKLLQYVHPLDKDHFLDLMDVNQLHSREEFSFAYRVDFTGTGTYEWWECRGVFEHSRLGEQSISYLYGLHININEIKEKEQKAALNQQLFTLVGDAAKIGYAKYNLRTGKGMALPQWFKNLDISPANMADFDFRETFNYVSSDQRYDLLKFYVRAICRQETTYSCDKKIITPGGKVKWLHGNMLVVDNAEGESELIEITYDITAQKKVEKDLIVAKNKAESANQLKSAFLANMSHEIRTPLNAIVGFCDLLASSECSIEDRENYAKVIASNNELLLKLINDILDLTKIESGFIDFNYSGFDLSEFFRDVKILFDSRMPAGVELKLDNLFEHYTVSMDREKLLQIIGNLVNNAIKFTEKGSITMGYTLQRNEIVLFVRDTGIGILPENKSRVFERFEKLNSFSPGSGLGLSICKAIVEAAGGKIEVDSVYGEGATFYVHFPIDRIDTHHIPVPDTVAEEEGGYELSEPIRSSKILVAEDIDSNYLLVKNILKDYQLVRAHDGDEVIEMIQRDDYDLILMDIRMPGLTGLEAAKIIREFNDEIPIIAVTAYAFDTDREKIMEAGCDKFIAKPFSKQELIATVNEALTMERVNFSAI